MSQSVSPRVLLIDDQALISRLVGQMLQSMELLHCSDPCAALELMRAFRPTVVLLDMEMPDKDGLTVLREIRADGKLRRIPVVMFTSRSGLEDRIAAWNAGASDYVIKSCEPLELAARLQSHTLAYRQFEDLDDRCRRLEEANSRLVATVERLSVSGSSKGSSASSKSLRILLAEDVPFLQKFLTRGLTKMGHIVTGASNGLEALTCWDRETFDLVLMDLEMPGMDGFAAVERMRAGGRPGVPIVALTAHTSPEVMLRAEQAGVNAFLTKPVSETQLREAVARWSVPQCGNAIPASGVDMSRLLAAAGGDRHVARELISDLVSDLTKRGQEFSTALADGKRGDAARCAHSLKGLAATIGADRLQDVAGRAEELVRTSGTLGEGLREELGSCLAPLLESLESCLKEQAPI